MYDQNSYPNDYQNHNNTNTAYTPYQNHTNNTNTGSYQYGNTYPNDYSHMDQKKPKEKKTHCGGGGR